MPRVANFIVHVDPDVQEPQTVNYTTRNGTAIAGVEYTAKSGTLNFAIGEG